MRSILPFTIICLTIFFPPAFALAAQSPASKCESTKNKIVGKYAACRQAAYAKAEKLGTAPEHSKCDEAFEKAWAKAEGKADMACPTSGDQATIQDFTRECSDAVAAALDGDGLPACGNDDVDAIGEHCDGTDLDGHTCSSFGYSHGALACSAECEFDTSGCNNCSGFLYSGACWFFGSIGQSCDAACSGMGLGYDSRTATIAGSGGSDASCIAILGGLGVDVGGIFTGTGLEGAGCGYDPNEPLGVRYTNPATTGSAAVGTVQRVCACR